MSWKDIFGISASFIASLGGGAAIVLVFSNWFGKILADRYVERLKHELQQEVESYKTKLKKSEFLFEKEFEAASRFISLRRSLLPGRWYSEMDWGEACETFALGFDKVERALESYISVHGAALSHEELDQLARVLHQVVELKFEVQPPDQVTKKGIDLADEVMNGLEEIERGLWKRTRAQVTS
jgi:hypothetical protein